MQLSSGLQLKEWFLPHPYVLGKNTDTWRCTELPGTGRSRSSPSHPPINRWTETCCCSSVWKASGKASKAQGSDFRRKLGKLSLSLRGSSVSDPPSGGRVAEIAVLICKWIISTIGKVCKQQFSQMTLERDCPSNGIIRKWAHLYQPQNKSFYIFWAQHEFQDFRKCKETNNLIAWVSHFLLSKNLLLFICQEMSYFKEVGENTLASGISEGFIFLFWVRYTSVQMCTALRRLK